MSPKKEHPVIAFASADDWEAWLAEHHATPGGIWIKFARKGSGIASVSHPQALDTALCYGWIDGQTASCDRSFWLQRFAPRRPRSKWSQINRDKAEALAAAGRMKAPGYREIESARRDGRWEKAYPSPRNMPVPGDLQQRLDEHPEARQFFASLDSRNRYAILYRIHEAQKPETRARRIEKYVATLRDRKTLH